jgi:guanyl-specific ribonuclease Sa
VRQIAKDAVSTVIADLKAKGQTSPEEVSASIAGAMAGIEQAAPSELAQTEVQIEQLPISEDQTLEMVDAQTESALVVIAPESESTQQRSLFNMILIALREKQLPPEWQQQITRLQRQMGDLDEKLSERYGDRYAQFKQRLAATKVWYNETKAKAEVSQTSPVDRTQADLEVKAAAAGVAAAQLEKDLKQRIKTYLQTAIDRL